MLLVLCSLSPYISHRYHLRFLHWDQETVITISRFLAMFANLINVSLQYVDPVQLKQALSAVIKKDFFQPASSFANDLDQIQNVHDFISSESPKLDPDLESLESALYSYFHLVEGASKKFPDHVATITWYSNLGYKPKRCVASTWRELQGYIVCQLGSVYSMKAFKQSQHTDEGIKAACAFFKLAAGCYEFVRRLKVTTTDLDESTLMSLQWLMLAQAQELTWNKAISNTGMKNTVIARLSVKVSEMYDTALLHAEKSDSIILDWMNQFKVKRSHFMAAASFRMSIVALDSFEYGQQVAHLKHAAELCAEASKYKRYVNAAVLEDLQGLTNVVNETLRSAEKDNDLVYLKPVPNVKDLPEIVGVSMVSADIPPKLSETENSTPAFASLIPFHIIQVAQAFKERHEQFITDSFQEPLQALTRMLGKFLTEQDLPASIDTLQKPENLPESILHHLQEITAIGGIKLIETSMAEISKLASQSQELVEACEERLRMEKYEDDLMREREGSTRWNRPTSEAASAEFHARIAKMKSFLEIGHQSDVFIGDNYASILPFVEIYCRGQEALVEAIPRSTHTKIGPALAKLVAELRDLLTSVEKLEKGRQRFLSGIEIKARDHNVLPAILNEFKKKPANFQDANGNVEPVKFEPIYERHIKFYANDLRYLEQLKEEQMGLERKILACNREFSHARTLEFDKSQSRRLERLRSFEEAYVQYLELVANLNQASKFYSDFLEKGNVVLQEVDGFLYARREEARELQMTIHNANNLDKIEQSMTQGSSLPAPRGQKPSTWDPSKGINFS